MRCRALSSTRCCSLKTLSYLAEDTDRSSPSGTLTGEGRIDWIGEDYTSPASAQFASDGFDFAAPFGPVARNEGQGLVSAIWSTLPPRSDQVVNHRCGSTPASERMLAGKVPFAH